MKYISMQWIAIHVFDDLAMDWTGLEVVVRMRTPSAKLGDSTMERAAGVMF